MSRAITLVDVPKAKVFGTLKPPSPVIVAPSLRVSGKLFLDGDRQFYPRAVSMLSALLVDKDQRAKFRAHAKATGYNGLRYFCGALWGLMTAQQALDRIEEALDEAAADGFFVDATLLTDTDRGYDPEEHLARMADKLRGRGYVHSTLANEVGHSTQVPEVNYENLRKWGQKYFGGMVWACGAPEYAYVVPADSPHPAAGRTLSRDEPWPVDPYHPETGDKFEGDGGPSATAHLDRGRDEMWEQGRRVREIFACTETIDKPVVNAEPGRDFPQAAWGALRGVLDRGFSSGGGVDHHKWGLECRLPTADEQAQAEAYTGGHKVMNEILRGRRGWYRNSRGQDSPVGAYPDSAWGKEIVRHYSFVLQDDPNRAASTVIGLKNPDLKLAWANGFQPVSDAPAAVWRDPDGSQLQVWEVAR